MNRLKGKAEDLLDEERAGFKAGRSTTEKIFNVRLIIEKRLLHQRDLIHNFIDFKKAFDCVWHDGLWQVMRNYNFDEDLKQVIQAPYANSNIAVLLKNQLGELFRTTVRVRQRCSLSPVLFKIFIENTMQETLQDVNTAISIGGRAIYNLLFADNIDLIGGSDNELQDLTTILEDMSRTGGMEISSEKSKVIVNRTAPLIS